MQFHSDAMHRLVERLNLGGHGLQAIVGLGVCRQAPGEPGDVHVQAGEGLRQFIVDLPRYGGAFLLLLVLLMPRQTPQMGLRLPQCLFSGAQLRFVLFAGRNVPGNHRHPDDTAVSIENRRIGQGYLNLSAIFGQALGLVMLDTVAALYPGK
jgi:hypothetical protein